MSLQDHLQPGEEILYQAHVTRLTQVPQVALLAVALAFTIFAWLGLKSGFVVACSGLFTVSFGLAVAWELLRLGSYEFVLTNHRVIYQAGILAKSSMDSRLDKINNIELRQTLWGSLLGYGDVEVDTASGTGICLFSDIANPQEFKRAILAAAEQYRASGFALPVAAGPSGAERLRQLKALMDDGLISKEEFEAKRRELVAQL